MANLVEQKTFIHANGNLERLRKITEELTSIDHPDVEYKKKYEMFIENINAGVLAIDENEDITFANKKMCDMLRYTKEEVLNLNFFQLFDEKYFDFVKKSLNRRKLGLKEINVFTLKTKNNENLTVTFNTGPLFEHNDLYKGAVAIVSEVYLPIVNEF
jgi:hypothetical protein